MNHNFARLARLWFFLFVANLWFQKLNTSIDIGFAIGGALHIQQAKKFIFKGP